jgi:hypothetical protein
MNPFRIPKVGIALLTILFVCVCFIVHAIAEDEVAKPKEWIVNEGTIQQRSQYRQDLRTGTVPDAGAFDHVVRWKLSRLTRVEELFDAPKMRQQIRGDLEVAGRAPESHTHDRIVHLALKYLPLIVNDRSFHAGARYNALLMVGELNSQERQRIGATTPEQALTEALPLLLEWLEVGSKNKERHEDIIPVGTLIGILRHASLGIKDEPLRQRTVAAALHLASQSMAPLHRTADGHDWIRRRSVQVLGWAVSPDQSPIDGQAATFLLAAMDDSNNSLKLQVEAALAWSVMAARTDDYRIPSVVLSKYTDLAARIIEASLKDALSPRPSISWSQSRRVISARLAKLFEACSNLGVDPVSLRHASPPPTDVTSLRDLSYHLSEWIDITTKSNLPAIKAIQKLKRAIALLNPPPVTGSAP